MNAVLGRSVPTADEQILINTRWWRLAYGAVVAVCVVVVGLSIVSERTPFVLSVTAMALLVGLLVLRPDSGLRLMVFLFIIGDGAVAAWYPFGKNLSSRESIFYVHDQLIISPLEILLGLAVLLLFVRTWLGGMRFERGPLFGPIAVFMLFVLAGLAYGIGTGGDTNAAVWEARPFFYLPIFYILCVNFFTSRRDYMRLAWQSLVAMSIESLLALQYFFTLDGSVRARLESLLSHQSAMHMNMVYVFLLASLTIPGIRRGTRWMVVVLGIPITWVYLLSQRRAAIVSLAIAIVLLGMVLWRLNRKALIRAGPIFVVLVAAYVGAFWNNTSLAGFPAQAIKTVIAPGSVPEEDQSSDAYRAIENYDLHFTIKSEPLTGVGFGQRFYRPIPLPDISFFPFYEYIPHNSVLWIWLKMGVGGFIATMLLFAMALRLGLRTALRMRKGNEAVIAFVAFSYLPMYLVFTYVDISWDGRSLMLVAIAMALAGHFADLPKNRGELPDRRDDGSEAARVGLDPRPRFDPSAAARAELVGPGRVGE